VDPAERYLAHHGWNVLAVDLPGHCRSGGEAPSSVEEAADFIWRCWTRPAWQAALVGHSWGSLIALEAAARAKSASATWCWWARPFR
jgi:pimeloyl-ACP methyl ester carboxylesterase